MQALRRFARHRSALVGLIAIVLVAIAALAAPEIAHRLPLATSADAMRPPLAGGFLGTDNLGRDIWSGVVYGGRISLTVGLAASALATLIGIIVGAIAGYRGGVVDLILMRTAEFFQVIPQFFLALVLVAILGRGIEKVIAVLAVVGWPLTARIVRGQFMALRKREYVEAARAVGAGDWYIAVRVILPNAMPPVIVTATQGVAHAILLEAGISFFGLGDPNSISWGTMLNTAQPYLQQSWWMSVFPGLAIVVSALGFSLLGDGLNDAFNPRTTAR
ncbi:MAG: ABC transporter permease [Candidatus Velthaea sp.]